MKKLKSSHSSTTQLALEKQVSEFQDLTLKNKSIISQFQLENTILNDQLLTQKQKNQSKDQELNTYLVKLQDECSLLAQKLEIENKKKLDLTDLCQQMKSKLQATQKFENASQGAELPKKIKDIKNNELKLQQTHQKHNEQLAEIQELKEMLNVARRERVIYSTVFKGIEMDAIMKQRELMKLIKENELQQEEKKYLVESLEFIQNICREEQNKFQKVYRAHFENLDKIQEEAQPTYETNISTTSSPAKRKQKSQLKDLQQSQQLLDASQFITEVAISPTSKVPPKKSETVQLMETEETPQVKEFETSFKKLFVEVGLNSVDEIIQLYNNQEQLIDDTFLETNYLQSQITALKSELSELDQELKKYQHIQLDLQQRERLEKMEQEKKVDSSNNVVDQLIKENKQELKQIKEQLMQIQSVLDFNLFDEDTNEWNLSSYSKEIEAKVNNILTIFTSLEKQAFSQIKVPFNQGPTEDDTDAVSEQDQSKNQKLDELLNNIDKIKESEKIISKQDLMKQSLQIIQKEQSGKKNLKKIKI